MSRLKSIVPSSDLIQSIRIAGAYVVDHQERQSTISVSPGFREWLSSTNVALAFSACDFGALHLLGVDDDGLIEVSQYGIDHSTGLVLHRDHLILATRRKIVLFGVASQSAQNVLFTPSRVFEIELSDLHEIGVTKAGQIVLVETARSCLVTLRSDRGANLFWKPSFIEALGNEDRCHLNGVAFEGGMPRYVTAFARSNEPRGWRDVRCDAGVIISVDHQDVVLDGLVRPHSPRIHEGQLYYLDSGRGRLMQHNRAEGKTTEVAFLPGFLRGLSFFGGYAAVTSSLPRRELYDLPLDGELADRGTPAMSGVYIVELATGTIVQWIRFSTGIREMFDVVFLPGARRVRFRLGVTV